MDFHVHMASLILIESLTSNLDSDSKPQDSSWYYRSPLPVPRLTQYCLLSCINAALIILASTHFVAYQFHVAGFILAVVTVTVVVFTLLKVCGYRRHPPENLRDCEGQLSRGDSLYGAIG
jgi:hypothetical protein